MRKLSSVVKDKKVIAVFETMGPMLHAAIAARQSALTEEEEAELVQPVNLFDSPNLWQRYQNDIKIYTEACLAHAKSVLLAQMLITNDHKFFTDFGMNATFVRNSEPRTFPVWVGHAGALIVFEDHCFMPHFGGSPHQIRSLGLLRLWNGDSS